MAGSSVAVPRAGRGRERRGVGPPGEAGSGGHVGTARRDMWHPLRPSHSLAVVPSAPRSESFQIIVKAASRPPPGRGRRGGPLRAKPELEERLVTTGVM